MNGFTQAGLTAELRQGEILTGVVQYDFDPVAEQGIAKPHPFSMVVHQDCDLLWDFKRAEGKPPIINSILLVELHVPDKENMAKSNSVWEQLVKNKQERWHFLHSSTANSKDKLPDLIADFRRLFTMRPAEIYRQIQKGETQRQCVLDVPYREHFQSRFAYYLQRVALPDVEK